MPGAVSIRAPTGREKTGGPTQVGPPVFLWGSVLRGHGVRRFHLSLGAKAGGPAQELGADHRLEAVSYTHLDVYKRQERNIGAQKKMVSCKIC